MVILRLLMKIGNISYIDEYIAHINLEKIKNKDFKKFLLWYLSQEADSRTQHKEQAFHILNEARKRIPLEDLDEMAINSKMLETKDNYDFTYFFMYDNNFVQNGVLLNLESLPLLQTYITSRVMLNRSLIDFINRKANIDYDYAIRRLVSVNDIDTLIEYAKKMTEVTYRSDLAKQMVLSGAYTLEEIKRYIDEVGIPADTIIEIFTLLYESKDDLQEKENALNTFITIINYSEERIANGQKIDKKTGEHMPGYDTYTYYIAIKKVAVSMKNRMAKKLLKEKNYQFINYWLLHDVECDYNYNLINALMLENKEIIQKILATINNKYLEYALTRLLNRDKKFVSEIIECICNDYDKLAWSFDIDRIDCILDFIYFRYYDFKLSKKSAINLIKLGSKYIPKFMSEYDFNEGERQDIYNAYKNYESDFIRIYGLYLISGDKEYLYSEKDAKEKFERLESRRIKLKETGDY